MVKPYTHLQSQGQGHIKMAYSCRSCQASMQRYFAFADPLWPCIMVKVIKMSMSILDIPYPKFECQKENYYVRS